MRKKQFCLMGILLLLSFSSSALKESAQSKLIEYLAAEKVNLTLITSHLRAFSEPMAPEMVFEQKAWIEKQQKLIVAKIETLNAFLDSQNKRHTDLQLGLKKFKASSVASSEALRLQASVNEARASIEVNEKAIELIQSNLALAYRYQKAIDKYA